MEFWENVKKDLNKAWDEGISAVKDGSRFAARKVDQLTQDGKRLYKAYDLKTDVHREIGELGGLIYSLKSKAKGKTVNPLDDKGVQEIIKKIDGLKNRIAKLEAEGRKPRKKAAARKKTATRKKKKTASAKS